MDLIPRTSLFAERAGICRMSEDRRDTLERSAPLLVPERPEHSQAFRDRKRQSQKSRE
jgi:hypothetical protein